MRYMGGKRRIARYIIPRILHERKKGQLYVEPFVGGCNTIEMVPGFRIGCDINEYLICMLQAASDGWIPRDDYTEEHYHYVRNNKNEDKVLTGYFGFALSFGGKFFGGWCRDSSSCRDYIKQAQRNALKQFPKLYNIHFICDSYCNLIYQNCIIYCDPPYENTTAYKDKNSIDYNLFWDWCRFQQNFMGNKVFISSYKAPDDFECIFELDITSNLSKDSVNNMIGREKLFKLRRKRRKFNFSFIQE